MLLLKLKEPPRERESGQCFDKFLEDDDEPIFKQ